MNSKPFTKIGSAIFGIMALLHLCRLIFGWQAVIGGHVVPLWASGVFIAIAAVMAFGLRREAQS